LLSANSKFGAAHKLAGVAEQKKNKSGVTKYFEEVPMQFVFLLRF
jgi:hypothetical protein